MRRARTHLRSVLAAVLTFALVLLTPAPALAAIIMTDGSVYGAVGHMDYHLTTTYRGWSAVAVYSNANHNVGLFQGTTGWAWLNDSGHYGAGKTEFVAINSQYRPLSSYRAEVIQYIGNAPSYTQWIQALHDKVVLPYPANDGVTGPGDPDITFIALSSDQVVRLFTIELQAWDAFWVRDYPDNNVFFLESNPYHPTQIVNRREVASAGVLYRVGNCTLYRASRSGKHALLIVSNYEPYTVTPGQGIAIPLHRFDPSRPYTCPQQNFPEYTPPGP